MSGFAHGCAVGVTAAMLLSVVSVASAASEEKTVRQLVSDRSEAILEEAKQSGDFRAAQEAAQRLFDGVAGRAPASEAAAFREAAFCRRLIRQLHEIGLDDEKRRDLLGYLLDNRELARALVFMVRPEDELEQCYAVLQTLREKHGERLNRYANLTAALCVVHDREVRPRVRADESPAPAPEELFAFYTTHRNRMFFGIRNVPAELLIYVVGNTVEIGEMRWALERYAGRQKIGKVFFQVRYDYEGLRTGTRKVTKHGYSLPNILKHGGICADQAYFATAVARSIGVPAAYCVGRSGKSAHAWVGFLDQRRRKGFWNFNVGRYPAYQGVRGVVRHPQTGQRVPDAHVAVLAEMIGTSAEDRQTAIALIDAADRVLERDSGSEDWPELAARDRRESPRGRPVEDGLALVEAGLKHNVACAAGWFLVRRMAAEGQLSLEQTRTWAGRVQKLCGKRYPDFALAVLRPMIQSVESAETRITLWERALEMFSDRADLAAEARLKQGDIWREQGEKARAGKAYMAVVQRYPGSGKFFLDAIEKAKELLKELGREERVLELYKHAWKRTKKPSQYGTRFFVQSNWYKVGVRYARLLKEAGRSREAGQAAKRIERASGKELEGF